MAFLDPDVLFRNRIDWLLLNAGPAGLSLYTDGALLAAHLVDLQNSGYEQHHFDVAEWDDATTGFADRIAAEFGFTDRRGTDMQSLAADLQELGIPDRGGLVLAFWNVELAARDELEATLGARGVARDLAGRIVSASSTGSGDDHGHPYDRHRRSRRGRRHRRDRVRYLITSRGSRFSEE